MTINGKEFFFSTQPQVVDICFSSYFGQREEFFF